MAEFGDRLKALRQRNKLGQKEVGAILGVSDSSIRKYEKGERTPTPEAIKKLSDYFGVSADYILGNEPSFEVMAADRLPEEVVPIMKLAAELFQDDPAILDLLTKKASNLYGNKAWAESDITDMPEEKKTMIKLAIKAGLEAIEKK